MAKEVTAEQALSAANELVKDVSDFGDAVKAEVRHHTGGRRKHAYVARTRPMAKEIQAG